MGANFVIISSSRNFKCPNNVVDSSVDPIIIPTDARIVPFTSRSYIGEGLPIPTLILST